MLISDRSRTPHISKIKFKKKTGASTLNDFICNILKQTFLILIFENIFLLLNLTIFAF